MQRLSLKDDLARVHDDLKDALARVHDDLMSHGYAVIDDALPAGIADALRADMETLQQHGGLRQHRFAFKSDTVEAQRGHECAAQVQVYTKPHIFEAELGDDAVKTLTPQLAATLDHLGLPQAAHAAFPFLRLVTDPGRVAVKMQCNEGNGCFPLHYDNAGPPSNRRLTALFYLNPSWKEGDGGELLLCPWLRPSVCVPPLHGRIVLFQSDVMLHRVLPNHARRFCFTIWIDGMDTNSPAALQLDSRKPCDSLLLDPAQRLVSRATYADEYERSIRECFSETPEQLAAVLRQHHTHVSNQMTGATPTSHAFKRLVDKCREVKCAVAPEVVYIAPPTAREPVLVDVSDPSVLDQEREAMPMVDTTQPVVQLEIRALSEYRCTAWVAVHMMRHSVT